MTYNDEMLPDEFRVICPREEPPKPFYRKPWFWILMAAALLAVGVVLALLLRHSNSAVTDSMPLPPAETTAVVEQHDGPATVCVRDTSINDVPLRILTPVNARAELMIGKPDTLDKSIILAAQAADIRADNQKIVGAFVLKGEPVSWGKAKTGFCAIVENRIYVGTAENTPLFEETTEKNGYFFRQYPLVSQGKMVENKPKNKALRHSLCELDGQIVVVSSLTKESFHDFAQALEDLGVQEAIYLVGGQSFGFCRLADDSLSVWGAFEGQQNNEYTNFILWRAQ
ncbi:MAG: hypothetical protein J5741_00850 [Bacteroidales bacterium]|nr:hypothetical protein [Bacteroidales bacterium]